MWRFPSVRPDFELRKKGQARWSEGLTPLLRRGEGFCPRPAPAFVWTNGKETTVALLSAGDFVGEESIAGVVGLRLATATAIAACTALKTERSEMIRVLYE
jgi:hypothetical protein